VPAEALAAAGAQCISPSAESMAARVTRVLSGDTIEVAVGNDLYRVRYIGVRAPIASFPPEWAGPEAAAENKRLAGSQVVTLFKDTSDADSSGALLRYVIVGKTFVNFELVKAGLAAAAPVPPDLACIAEFQEAQTEAQTAARGMWAPTPIPSSTPKPTSTVTPTPGTTTPTLAPACDCTASLTCNDFTSQSGAQACLEYCKAEDIGNVTGLDKNNNGIACEGLP
jgi:endonuclease YncB( thermonuclease family)